MTGFVSLIRGEISEKIKQASSEMVFLKLCTLLFTSRTADIKRQIEALQRPMNVDQRQKIITSRGKSPKPGLHLPTKPPQLEYVCQNPPPLVSKHPQR